jgi:antitoxin ParD1/3/4
MEISIMSRNTSVEIDDQLGHFVDRQVQSGRYASASEVVCAGLRHLQNQETKMASLRAAVAEGLESGPAQPFDFDEFLATRHSRRL